MSFLPSFIKKFSVIVFCNRYAELDELITSDFLKTDLRSMSFDSLLESESTTSVDDVAGCCEIQNNQIFIGMVTLQYQARQVTECWLSIASFSVFIAKLICRIRYIHLLKIPKDIYLCVKH